MPKGVRNGIPGIIAGQQAASADDALALLVARAQAEADAGTCESPRGSNRGPALTKIFAADDYQPTGRDENYPWCASFICYVTQRWLADNGPAGEITRAFFGAVKPPRTASAWGLIDWATDAKNVQIISGGMLESPDYRPVPGDIVVFNFHHCGIVAVVSKDGKTFTAIEGNTDTEGSREGWQVARRPRRTGQVKALLRFIPRPASK